MSEQEETTVVVRLSLDPTREQEEILYRYADSARCAYNFALGLKVASHQRWQYGRDKLVAAGMNKKEANKKAPKVPIPGAFQIKPIFLAVRDRPLMGPYREGEELRYRYPWWKGVNARTWEQAFADADKAWSNWMSSSSGKRKGGPVGYPKFKRKGRCRDSFRLIGVKPVGERHLRIPGEKGGQKAFNVRLHCFLHRLEKWIRKGGVIKTCTVSREGHRWFASVNVRISKLPNPRPAPHQVSRGAVGVDLGVSVMAAMSNSVTISGENVQLYKNPKHLDDTRRVLTRWQRRMARRYVKGKPAHEQSKGWHEAKAQVSRLHALIAARRASTQHLLTKRLTTQFSSIALEDLDVKQLTQSAKGDLENPGKHVRVKAGFNRMVLDVGFGEIRRQVEYKSTRYGSSVALVNPAYTSQTCNACGNVDKRNRKSPSVFVCTACGKTGHSKIIAARNIRSLAERVE
ncbi:RNA-guided endonuclease TnpB family protein [Streptomyces sp. 5-10]|uniref:RNA-guided endonuclease InsQ/TnpB family protein n=1 Tax=Streptomyces sp. 5-10 TaxID=878925 RepID=UPI00168B6F28|nr:RNA-guided endonuclease TnpB family protein [Streptomyces sp. 5-10]MBD3004714.1 transposase [Streptomyces sp. 5-10]